MSGFNWEFNCHTTKFYGLFLVTACIFSSILSILFNLWCFVVLELIWGVFTLCILFLTVSKYLISKVFFMLTKTCCLCFSLEQFLGKFALKALTGPEIPSLVSMTTGWGMKNVTVHFQLPRISMRWWAITNAKIYNN